MDVTRPMFEVLPAFERARESHKVREPFDSSCLPTFVDLIYSRVVNAALVQVVSDAKASSILPTTRNR